MLARIPFARPLRHGGPCLVTASCTALAWSPGGRGKVRSSGCGIRFPSVRAVHFHGPGWRIAPWRRLSLELPGRVLSSRAASLAPLRIAVKPHGSRRGGVFALPVTPHRFPILFPHTSHRSWQPTVRIVPGPGAAGRSVRPPAILRLQRFMFERVTCSTRTEPAIEKGIWKDRLTGGPEGHRLEPEAHRVWCAYSPSPRKGESLKSEA